VQGDELLGAWQQCAARYVLVYERTDGGRIALEGSPGRDHFGKLSRLGSGVPPGMRSAAGPPHAACSQSRLPKSPVAPTFGLRFAAAPGCRVMCRARRFPIVPMPAAGTIYVDPIQYDCPACVR